MVASIHQNVAAATFLTPGQQFSATEYAELGNEPLIVARLVRDRLGMMHVTMRTSSGREISAFVEQIEIAVSEGHLVPVATVDSSIAC